MAACIGVWVYTVQKGVRQEHIMRMSYDIIVMCSWLGNWGDFGLIN